MSVSIPPVPVGPIFIEHKEFGGKKESSWGSWMKNALTGRACSNWRAKVVMAMTVVNVIAAVVTFFAGEWVLSTVFLLGSGINAMMHRELQDFANLRKANVDYGRHNNKHEWLNSEFSKDLDKLKDIESGLQCEVGALNGEVTKMKDLAEQQKAQIARNALIQEAMETQIGTMKSVLEGQNQLTEDQRQEFLAAVAQFDAKKQAFDKLEEEMTESLRARVKDFSELVTQINSSMETLSVEGVKALSDAHKKLAATQARQEEIDQSLAKRRRELEEATGKLQKVTAAIEKATSTNAMSAQEIRALLQAAMSGAALPPPKRAFPAMPDFGHKTGARMVSVQV